MGSNKPIKPGEMKWNNGKAVFNFPERIYELKGLTKEAAKVQGHDQSETKKHGNGMFLDTLDFYSARSRMVFARAVVETFGVKDVQIANELMAMINPIDKYKEDKSKEPDA